MHSKIISNIHLAILKPILTENLTMFTVLHLTSVHPRYDNRIFFKECQSLAKSGYNVSLVVADGKGSEVKDGVIIHDIGLPKNRFERILKTTYKIFKKAKVLNADLYHIHDPELIIFGFILSLQKKKVVYDIHEDYFTDIKNKTYLSKWLRLPIAFLTFFVECFFTYTFYKIAAEKYYLKRFPAAITILNYPQITIAGTKSAFNHNSNRFLYTGSVSIDRGALHLSRLVYERPDIEVTIVGRCPPALAKKMRKESRFSKNLNIVSEGRYIPFKEILSYYRQSKWMAALVLFPDTELNRQKELTKFFEYMAIGLPIIASNFPVWIELIEKQGFGLCVDPMDFKDIGNAIDWLREHPDECKKMAQRGQTAVKDMYNWEQESQKLIKYYKSILN